MSELSNAFLSNYGWMKSGDTKDELVISSRIRLARNIEGFPFSQWASSTDLMRVAEQAKEVIPKSEYFKNAEIFNIEELEPIDRNFLAERYIISQELAKSGIERYVVIHPDQTVAIMINEEDHLRLQVLISGHNLQQAWKQIDAIDDDLEKSLNYAFSNTYGYLTACPTNVGTGIRCSVMVHLPALVITRQIEKVLSAVTQIGLTVRGLSGEGSDIAGNLFQISNQWTLGISEIDTIGKIENILHHITEQEMKAQNQLMEENRTHVEDRVWRAYATLRHARVMSTNEAIELLSSIRLGRRVGILDDPSYESLSEMLILIRPAHLQKRAGKKFSTSERDKFRSMFLREWIGNGHDF